MLLQCTVFERRRLDADCLKGNFSCGLRSQQTVQSSAQDGCSFALMMFKIFPLFRFEKTAVFFDSTVWRQGVKTHPASPPLEMAAGWIGLA